MINNPQQIKKIISVNQGEYSRLHFPIISEFLHTHQNSIAKDLECGVILNFLSMKVLESYYNKRQKISYEKILQKENFYIGNFKKSSLAKILNLPRETIRRKLLILLKKEFIVIKNKEYFLKKKYFINLDFEIIETQFQKCINFLLNKIENDSDKNSKLSKLNIDLRKDFSLLWYLILKIILNICLLWKEYHGSLESYYLFGTCSLNQMYNLKKYKNFPNKKFSYTENFFLNITEKDNISRGLNPTTLSELTGIPRTTVMRNLKKMINIKTLSKNQKNLYYIPRNTNQKKSIVKILQNVHEIISHSVYATIKIYI